MTTAELVQKLLEAIADSNAPLAVSIAVQAVEEAAEAPPRRRRRRKAAEVVSVVR